MPAGLVREGQCIWSLLLLSRRLERPRIFHSHTARRA
jgi:hypothetical protein